MMIASTAHSEAGRGVADLGRGFNDAKRHMPDLR
jgi:hypothetical protein